MNQEEYQPEDCVQIYKEDSEYHGQVGRVKIFRRYDSPQLCLVQFDNHDQWYFNVKYLIKRHIMACADE